MSITPAWAPESGSATDQGLPARSDQQRLFVLDGWRGISILLILATHLLPLGPKAWSLNAMSGYLGMSLFFTLSGFLITQQLHAKRDVVSFLVRRLFRIVPLAWLYVIVALALTGSGARMWAAHLLFWANYNFHDLTEITTHFWSLCVEVQFYLGIGLLMAATRFRGFLVLPFAWFAFFLVRCFLCPMGSMETHLRVDEILSGTCLALVSLGYFGPRARALVKRLPFPLLALALLAASHPSLAPLNALRGVFASCLIGHTLFAADPQRFRWLGHRTLRYLAETSYAIYVVHPLMHYGWLGSGPVEIKYLKRILTFLFTFGAAHLSTFHFEKPMIQLGKRVAQRLEQRRAR